MCKLSLEINAVAGSASEAVLVGLGAIPGAWLRLKVVNHLSLVSMSSSSVPVRMAPKKS